MQGFFVFGVIESHWASHGCNLETATMGRSSRFWGWKTAAGRQIERKRECQKICQTECRKECKKMCEKDFQKECQKKCQAERQKICQKECQKICQQECQVTR